MIVVFITVSPLNVKKNLLVNIIIISLKFVKTKPLPSSSTVKIIMDSLNNVMMMKITIVNIISILKYVRKKNKLLVQVLKIVPVVMNSLKLV